MKALSYMQINPYVVQGSSVCVCMCVCVCVKKRERKRDYIIWATDITNCSIFLVESPFNFMKYVFLLKILLALKST